MEVPSSGMDILHSENGIFPSTMESLLFCAKSDNSVHFCAAALKSIYHAKFCDRGIFWDPGETAYCSNL